MRNNGNRGNWKMAVLFVVILVSPFIFGRGIWEYFKSPVNKKDESVRVFVITSGETVADIAKRLKGEGLIRSEIVFKFSLKQQGIDGKIDAGDFKLSPSMGIDEVIRNLVAGPVDKWVTIVEGLRVEEVAVKLNEAFGVNREEFIKKAKKHEGYLFPDTYLFNPDASIEDIISIMKNNFEKKYTALLRQKINKLGLTDAEGLILASLVEREGRSDKVRTQVAGILLKRLNIGMKLDVDATVQYAKDSIAFREGNLSKFWQPVATSDYAVKSDYNTYLARGLPPGPICNPSLSALEAVANAQDTQYLYYFHDLKGNSYYAETLEEHNENVANHR